MVGHFGMSAAGGRFAKANLGQKLVNVFDFGDGKLCAISDHWLVNCFDKHTLSDPLMVQAPLPPELPEEFNSVLKELEELAAEEKMLNYWDAQLKIQLDQF